MSSTPGTTPRATFIQRNMYIHGRIMKNFLAVFALEAGEWDKAHRLLGHSYFRTLGELGQEQGL
eukprot:675454-Pleurochrysis_carterae.AAC.1